MQRYLVPYRAMYDRFKGVNLNLTRECDSLAEVGALGSEFDAIVVGSDQVWNLAYHPDPVYYLGASPDFEGKRLSYAACCGADTGKADAWVGDLLQEFDAISVRDEFTSEWVRSQVGMGACEPSLVVDPTLLYDFPEQPRPAGCPQEYIFAYVIGTGDHGSHRRVIAAAREKYGDLPVVLAMPTGYALQLHGWPDDILWMLDPFEWVAWLSNASFVYTDSFHGVLFSLKYDRPFVATYAEAVRSPRLIALRDQFQLGARIVQEEGDLGEAIAASDQPNAFGSTIETFRRSSIDFLERNLT